MTADDADDLRLDDLHRRKRLADAGMHPRNPERPDDDAIEHAQDRDYWRTERERLDAIDAEDQEPQQ